MSSSSTSQSDHKYDQNLVSKNLQAVKILQPTSYLDPEKNSSDTDQKLEPRKRSFVADSKSDLDLDSRNSSYDSKQK